MKKIRLGLAVLSFCVAILGVVPILSAEDPVLKDSHPDVYTVVKGDTLWDISETFLKNPWMWPEIWHVNPQVENPHLIYPGDVISLIYLDGRPRLTLERGNRSPSYKMSPGVDKLSPQVRVLPLTEAIPAIPLDAISVFLSRSRVVNNGDLEKAPYVLMGQEDHLVVGAGDNLYARGDFGDAVPVYGVYRKGKPFIDPETKELLGLEAQDIGSVELIREERNIATMAVTRTSEEIRIEDRLLPHEERAIDATFFPSAPDAEINGVIMTVEGGVNQVGAMNVVTINRGEREGLKVGNIMAIYKTGSVVRDRVTGDSVKLPDERAGLLMVFRIYEKMSYALVLESSRPLLVNDKVRNP